MQRVSIWDLDYYHNPNKKNCFNADVMKISSYHKQMGDIVTFVTSENDIRRPFDIYYIVKENSTTPNPPGDFFVNSKIKWWGKAYKARVNWKMNDAMLACRPDYLIYPERNTKLERAEHVRLFNNDSQPLPLLQDWRNTFKNKHTLITDTTMWFADKNHIIDALKRLQEVKKVSFLEPIWLQKIIYDKDIRSEFLKLHFTSGSKLTWTLAALDDVDATIEFVQAFKEKFPRVSAGEIVVDYQNKKHSHWESVTYAQEDFAAIKKMICRCKTLGVQLIVKMPTERFDTPYFFVFEELSTWTHKAFKKSWLEYLTSRFQKNGYMLSVEYWNHPEAWNVLFRDLLRQTWFDKEFLLHRWKSDFVSENDIPWQLWEKEFKIGL